MTYNQDLKKVMILYPEFLVQSSDDYRDLINIHNILETTMGEEPNSKIVEAAFEARNSIPLKTANDYFYLVFKSALDNVSFKKFAYPTAYDEKEIQEEFDIEKWAGLVHKIYDAVSSGDMKLPDAIDYYAESLDVQASEDESFKKWIKYYQSGEHLKYNKLDSGLKKEAFQFPLSGPGFYGPQNAIVPEENLRAIKKQMIPDENPKESFVDWRSKLYSAIRRIDKLLRQSDDFVSPEVQRDLSDLFHHFDQEIKSLRHEVMAADLAYKYANKLKKFGSLEGYDELVKYAQEINVPDELVPEEKPPEVPKSPGEEQQPKGNAIERSLSGASNAAEGEYAQLDGPIDLGDAVGKLEEIAGRLSDRRTIRLLAEFDIMLDKIGIAAMFPELAEAQSKLIDGYSYALTRVTKMLGMLSSGKSLMEISDAKKTDISDKAMKEVNKTFEEKPAEGEPERGTEAIQSGLDEKPEIPKPEQPVAPKPPTPEV